MTSPILVTGGTGTLGRCVVSRLRDAGREVRVLSRRGRDGTDGIRFVTGDLATGEGLPAAVKGVGTIVHCASSNRGDAEATRNLVRAASAEAGASGVGVPHLVYISIVGVDRLSSSYLRAKLESERVVAESGLPWTTLRATQFYDLILTGTKRIATLPVIPVPAGVVAQPIDADEVAARLAELALGAPAGRVPDMGGPRVLSFADLVRAYVRAKGRRRWVVPIRLPGTGAFRAGALLPAGQPVLAVPAVPAVPPDPARRAGAGAVAGQRTWEEFLAERLR
jgi:uncharacterized protein YbjT (DUF2867 family)